MDKLTIIDGSSLLYSASYNTSVKEEYTDDFLKYRETLNFYIESILEATEADKYIIFGDQVTSYRKKLFNTFKADRAKRPYMKFINDLMNYANTELDFFNHKDLEADDLCLLTHNKFKEEYDITIASKDSDLRQYSAKFFNYGIFRKSDYKEGDGFEEISISQARATLWKAVLIKGHNNKVDYLEGCGEKTAANYLKGWESNQFEYATLKAFIYGIDKDKDKNITRSVKGYGINKGIDKYNKSFKQTYLFRYLTELENLEIELDLPDFSVNSTKTEL